ncbi:MAG: DedA family protein [Dissulfurispiraceae bacterium]|jgi:membrane-associated protein
MELIGNLISVFMHLDSHLSLVIRQYGPVTYVILSLIIFCETGLVVTPFLPGDSLLFAAGTFAALGSFDISLLYVLLVFAAMAGNTTNYWIGYFAGPRVFHREDVRFLNRKHLERTHRFYEKYGGKTIIIARFIPVVRTFAPFVAGIGRMAYTRFLSYDIFGGTAWVSVCVFSGYFFGNIPVVRRNFSLVILAIIAVSVMPGVVEFIRHRRNIRRVDCR